MLTELTNKQEALLDVVAEEHIKLGTGTARPKMSAIKAWLAIAYDCFKLPVPKRIEVVASPFAAMKLATELIGSPVTSIDSRWYWRSGWLARYCYYEKIGILTEEENSETRIDVAFRRCTWGTLLLDECAIVIARPVAIHLDDDGNLHSRSGKPAIEWADAAHADKWYAWHGTWVPKRIVTEPRSFTADEYKAMRNTEERRALAERAGWEWIADLIGAKIVDHWKDPATGLLYELKKCTDGSNLLRMVSPVLKNGKQPVYMEPVHEDLRTAQAARKWQATRLTANECEADPGLRYSVEA